MSKTQVDTISCLQCGDVIPLDNAIEIQDDFLCPDCAETHTTVCHNCDERIWQDDDCGDEDVILCEHCRDNNYATCTDCGSLLHQSYAHYEEEDGDSPYCLECFQQLEKRSIHSYSYKSEPIFWGQGERYFGIELEVDDGGQDSRIARNILDILNKEKERGYIKSDGSLNDGMELVLHPMSLDFHLEDMPWREVREEFRNLGYYSHLTDTCSLHVHVNRSSLGKTQEEQESTIANILYFFERFWEEMLRSSRRTERQVRKWATRYGIESTGKLILEKAKKGFAGRYACVNLTKIKPDYLTRNFKKLCEENQIHNIRFHDLRHTAASFLINEGFSIKEVSEYLGHSNIGTTADIYGHLLYQSKVEMGNSISKKLNLLEP